MQCPSPMESGRTFLRTAQSYKNGWRTPMRLICADGRREERPEMCASKLSCIGGSPQSGLRGWKSQQPSDLLQSCDIHSRGNRGPTRAAVCFRYARLIPDGIGSYDQTGQPFHKSSQQKPRAIKRSTEVLLLGS